MLATLLVTLLVAVVLTSGLLVTVGHRLRTASFGASMATVAVTALISGEVAARLFLLPSALVRLAEVAFVAAGAVVARRRRSWNPVAVVFFAALTSASLTYLAAAAYATLAGASSPPAMAGSAAVFGLEAVALLLACSFAFETCDVACRARWDRPAPVFESDHLPFVSLQVAAYNEPPDMLIETIRSLEAIDYPHFEIVVVDNNTADEEVWRPVEAYCAGRPRVTFVHVAPWPGFKSGALNLVLARHTDPRAEIIGVVDADYVVDPQYLRRTVGYFADPALAFVQTPQDYREYEGDTYLTACYDAYKYFFATSMRSRNERNSIIFGGTMGLIRRDVLERLGGWDEWCITEDAESSLRMLRAGYSGLYLHETFGRGIMPLTFSALKRQRFRWCFGGIQILRKHWRSLLPWDRSPDNHLTAAQRLDYLIGGLQWFIDLAALGFTAILLAGAILAGVSGPFTFRALGGTVLLLPVVIAGTGLLRGVWALRHLTGISYRRAVLAFLNWLSLSWTVALACAKGLVRGEGVFLRTPKWRGNGGLREALRGTRVESTLAAVLWGIAAVTLATGRGLLVTTLALWQGAIYAAAPLMAWLNLHTELSARLQRRQRSEERRERLATLRPHLARATVGASAAMAVLFVLGGTGVGDQRDVLATPRRSPGDHGPLGNLGLLPDLAAGNQADALSEPPSTVPPPSTSANRPPASGLPEAKPTSPATQATPTTTGPRPSPMVGASPAATGATDPPREAPASGGSPTTTSPTSPSMPAAPTSTTTTATTVSRPSPTGPADTPASSTSTTTGPPASSGPPTTLPDRARSAETPGPTAP